MASLLAAQPCAPSAAWDPSSLLTCSSKATLNPAITGVQGRLCNEAELRNSQKPGLLFQSSQMGLLSYSHALPNPFLVSSYKEKQDPLQTPCCSSLVGSQRLPQPVSASLPAGSILVAPNQLHDPTFYHNSSPLLPYAQPPPAASSPECNHHSLERGACGENWDKKIQQVRGKIKKKRKKRGKIKDWGLAA